MDENGLFLHRDAGNSKWMCVGLYGLSKHVMQD